MIELLPDHAVKSRPQPGALWFSIAVHIAAFSFGIWRYEGPFRYNATVHAAAPTTITWFEGRLTLPGAPTSKGSAVPEETKSIPSTTNHTANSLVQRNSPSDSVGHSAPLAWFGGLLDEEGDQANLHAALNYRRAGGDSVGGLLSGMNGNAETGLALPPPPPPIAETKSDPPAAPATPEPPIRIGGHLEPAEIVKKTFPKYPPVAMQARVEGTVVLEATIGEDGKLHDIKVISGHPLLIGAATECIRNWRYRPAVLNGEIISSPATIEVRFIIQRSKSL
jgi:TonB family protein